MQRTPDFHRIGQVIETAPPIEVRIDVAQAIQLVGLMQFALRSPVVPGDLRAGGTNIVNQIGFYLGEIDPEVKALVDAGWSTEQDVSAEELAAAVEGDFQIVEVHNVFAVYQMNSDGTHARNPALSHMRPQDWGDPERWVYAETVVRFDAPQPDAMTVRYVQHCHIWRERRAIFRDDPVMKAFDPTVLFGGIWPQLFMVMMPGRPAEMCDRSHLCGSDIWLPEWGEVPPFFEPQNSDEGGDDE